VNSGVKGLPHEREERNDGHEDALPGGDLPAQGVEPLSKAGLRTLFTDIANLTRSERARLVTADSAHANEKMER
jgi:hypothetical protein